MHTWRCHCDRISTTLLSGPPSKLHGSGATCCCCCCPLLGTPLLWFTALPFVASGELPLRHWAICNMLLGALSTAKRPSRNAGDVVSPTVAAASRGVARIVGMYHFFKAVTKGYIRSSGAHTLNCNMCLHTSQPSAHICPCKPSMSEM